MLMSFERKWRLQLAFTNYDQMFAKKGLSDLYVHTDACFTFYVKERVKLNVVEEFSVGGVFRTINITRTHSVSTGRQRDFEKSVQLRRFCTYRPEILHTLRCRQHAKSDRSEFRISSPEKFGAPLNFAFALRPMGR